jgi:hypothetical protein
MLVKIELLVVALSYHIVNTHTYFYVHICCELGTQSKSSEDSKLTYLLRMMGRGIVSIRRLSVWTVEGDVLKGGPSDFSAVRPSLLLNSKFSFR